MVRVGFLAGSASLKVFQREEGERMGHKTRETQSKKGHKLLIGRGMECSSHHQSSEKILNSAKMLSILCCHLVAKLCQYIFRSCRISLDQRSHKLQL